MSSTISESKKPFSYKSHLAALLKLLEGCKTSAEAEAITARIEEIAGRAEVEQ